MIRALERLYGTRYMIAESKRLGEIPEPREAYGELARIAAPAVMEMVLMSLVSSVNTAMVGHLGAASTAAVGLTAQPRMLMLAIFMATNVGVTAIVARRKGEGRQEDANRTMRNAIVLILLLAGGITAFAILAANPLMRLVGAKEDTIGLATSYFRIISAGIPFNALTMAINAAQRGRGNTRVTMLVNITSNLFNLLFCYLLIQGRFGFPQLGVDGAAVAACIGFVVGFVLCIISVTWKGTFLKLRLRDNWRLDKAIVRGITKIGGNAVLEQVALRIGFMLFARFVADLGTMEFATHTFASQFLQITFTMGDGIGIAGTSLVGQNLGKKRPDLSMIFGKAAQRMALTASMILLTFIVVLRYPLFRLFTSDPDILALGAQIMIMVAIFQPFQTSSVVISGCLRGAGDTRFVAITMMACVTVIRPVVTYLMIYVFEIGLLGAWCAMLFDMILRLAICYWRFSSGKWFGIKV
ncbi:MAG: MATE family efflux transporter [Clostridiaceae bacterium]|nr:MATE family efflux transporter [Clostridiaceae bacterium]